MRKIIIRFGDLFNEDLSKISQYVDKTTEFCLLGDKNTGIPVSYIPLLQSFPSKIHFIQDIQDASMMKYILLGFLCCKAGKNDEICIIGEGDYSETLMGVIDSCVSQLFPEVKCTVKKTLMELLMERKKTGRSHAKKSKNTATVSDKKNENEETKPEVIPQKKDKRDDDDYNMRLLAKLKEINKNYPFEECINNIATAIANTTGKVSFEIQLRINCGKDRVEELYSMLSPYLTELKNLSKKPIVLTTGSVKE